MQTIGEYTRWLFEHHVSGGKISRLEIELLLAHVLKKNRAYLLAYPERMLSLDEIAQCDALVARRLQGEPLAYLVQEKEFWSLSLHVTSDTLIPRPETELLVEKVLELLPDTGMQRVADLGTGSGAIACAIAHERPHWEITATDLSNAALDVAKENARRHHLTQISFYQGAWCEALPHTQYHAILSNPPYIDGDDVYLAQGDLRFEPRRALISGEQGYQDLHCIILQAPHHLVAMGGWLLLEHGCEQGATVRHMMRKRGYQKIRTCRDLAGLERVSLAYFA